MKKIDSQAGKIEKSLAGTPHNLSIPSSTAYYCMDCEQIFNLAIGGKCSTCQSRSFMSIQKMIGKER